jgi:hypothetical protein
MKLLVVVFESLAENNRTYDISYSFVNQAVNTFRTSDQNQMVREGIQKYINEHNATLNEDDVRDFIDAYLLDIKHHKHEKYTLFMGK